MVGSEDPDQTALGAVLGQSDEGLNCLFLRHILNALSIKISRIQVFFKLR